MSYENMTLEHKDHVGIIILNRPEQYNTFTTTLAKELKNALIELENDKNVRVFVIKGAVGRPWNMPTSSLPPYA